MPSPTFTGEYAPNGKEDRAQVRADAGHRCIRCGHPYQTGIPRADKGEWSDCDAQCTHGGELRFGDYGAGPPYYPAAWGYYCQDNTRSPAMIMATHKESNGRIIIQAKWRILTVHHFDGDKSNDRWWNKLALCQKCHLSFQSRVNPRIPYMFEHKDWLKPYVAGFYAFTYQKRELTREEVLQELETLLALERLA